VLTRPALAAPTWVLALVVLAGCNVILGISDAPIVVSDTSDSGPGSAACESAWSEGPPNGAPLAPVARDDGTCWWMDLTEVTRDAYADFLAAGPSPTDGALQPLECGHNDTFAPDPECEADAAVTQDGTHPQAYITSCDALAHCRWAGKSLCIGSYAQYASTRQSTWHAACAGPNDHIYPYGNTYMATLCNGADRGEGTTLPAMGQGGCANEASILNLSGNLAEWTDECNDATGPTDDCRVRGGSFHSDSQELRCDRARAIPRDTARPDIGFRCCKEASPQ
jgi:formylglycine-generating enzyme